MDLPMQTTPDGLLVTRDLFFASKITGTAAELGFRVAVEGDAAQARRNSGRSSLPLPDSRPDDAGA